MREKTLRELYEIVGKEITKKVSPSSSDASMNLLFDYIKAETKGYESRLKRAGKRINKLKALKAPQIILENEMRVLGTIEGKYIMLQKILNWARAFKKLESCNACSGMKCEAVWNHEHKGCFNCVYCITSPTEDEECLCNSVMDENYYCPHFLLDNKPFWMYRDESKEKSQKKKVEDAEAMRNAVRRVNWEAEGKPDYSSEFEEMKNACDNK